MLQYLHKLATKHFVSFIVTWGKIKIKFPLHLIKQHARKAYGEEVVYLHSF
jgi:hypothetical protein